jgi:hypothetical protein
VRIAEIAGRLTPKLQHLFYVAALLYVALNGFGPVMNNVDLGWHVAEGRWMVQHTAVYRTDHFSYANAGRPVIDEYPLFQLVLYAAWSAGWWGPCLLTALAYLGLILPLAVVAMRLEAWHGAVLTLAVCLMLLCLESAPMLRPHIATYLGVVLLGLFLLRHRDAQTWRIFWPAALLQIAWTNSHSGFVIGPAMVGLFGTEITLRHWIAARGFPQRTALTWLGALALVLGACLVNPYGPYRFGPPLMQEQLESIRAYVGEMQPLPAPLVKMYGVVILAVGAGVISLSALGRKLPISFVLLAGVFLWEALDARKAWPVLGLFAPLIVLGGGAAAPSEPAPWRTWAACALSFLTAAAMAIALPIGFAQSSNAWQELARGHTELSVDAVAWMKQHGCKGRIFARCEDGGYLQMEGFDETFADTGFGKYSADFIHEVGLVNERPALLPRFLSAYQPDYVVCSNFCYQWPFYLAQHGWVPVHYSTNSSVWQRSGTQPAPATVGGVGVKKIFNDDLAKNGQPPASQLGRDIIALNSLGFGDFAFAQLTGLPEPDHHAAWYWEAARILCFDQPPLSAEHRAALMRQADSLPDAITTAEFRAYVKNGDGDTDDALAILKRIPPNRLGNWSAELLLRLELDRKDSAAQALARRTDCFDLRNGRHWQYLAEAEERNGSLEAARVAWRKAVFYYPDDQALMGTAQAFASAHADADLQRDIDAANAIPARR